MAQSRTARMRAMTLANQRQYERENMGRSILLPRIHGWRPAPRSSVRVEPAHDLSSWALAARLVRAEYEKEKSEGGR